MKHHYNKLACMMAAFLIAGTTNAQQITKKISADDALITKTSVKSTKTATPTKMMSEKTSMPKKEMIYFYSSENQDWNLSVTRSFIYGDYTSPLSWDEEIYRDGELLGITKYENTFNNAGQLEQLQTSAKDSREGEYRNEMLIKFVYDEIRKDALISRGEYAWDQTANDWVVQDVEAPFDFKITRNEKNDLVDLEVYNNVDRAILANKYTYSYGEGYGATDMCVSTLDYDGNFVPMYNYKGFKWLTTDNQYLIPSYNLMYLYENDDKNVPLEYSIYEDGGEGGEDYLIANVIIYYDEMNRPLQYNIFMEGSLYLRLCEYNPEEGIASRITEYTWYDEDENGEFADAEFAGGAMITNKVNGNNDITEYTYSEFYTIDGSDMTIGEGEKYDYVYEDGNMIEKLTYSYNLETGEYDPFSKIIRSDFEDISTAIKTVDSKHAATFINNRVYFDNAEGSRYIITDLQGNKIAHGHVTNTGISVDNLPSGVYLVKVMGQNGAAMKIVTK